jgi:hypothetical protein
MNKNRFRYIVTVITFLMLGYMFSGGDCGTDSDDPLPGTVAAPTNVRVVLDQVSSSFATIFWDHSPDQNRSDFAVYRVITYEVDSVGNVLSTFRVDENVPRTSNSQVINSIVPLTRYRTYVTAHTNTNLRSDSTGSIIYAAVFVNDGVIDEYQATGAAQSGFGWETFFGIGNQYAYTAENSARIDLHLRSDASGLRFYSPSEQAPGSRMTRFELIGQGQAAFDQTQLNEPTAPSIVAVPDNVYLLKLQSNHYVKIWVKSIQSAAGYQIVNFDYKLQPIEGLRVLKNYATFS